MWTMRLKIRRNLNPNCASDTRVEGDTIESRCIEHTLRETNHEGSRQAL